MRRRLHPLETIAEWFAMLQVDFVAAAQAAGNDTDKLVQAFEDCKAQAKLNFKQLAFDLHPDRAPEGERAEREERFKALSETWNQLKCISVKPRPKPVYQPPMQVMTLVTIFAQPGFGGTTTVDWGGSGTGAGTVGGFNTR